MDDKMNINENHTPYHLRRIKYAKKNFGSESLPHRYVFILTNKCNLACSFCFQERKNNSMALQLNDWIKVVNQMPDYAHVTLTGGEPLVFKEFNKIFNEIDKKFTTNIISNGLLINDNYIELFTNSKNFEIFSISIDDIGNINRKVRPDHWNRMLENLKKFKKKATEKKKKITFDAKTVVLDTNANDLFKIYKYLKEEVGFDTHSFQFLKGSIVQHADIMFPYSDIFNKYDSYEYENFGQIIEQLELVRQYNQKNNQKSYVHPNWIDLNSDVSIYDQNYQILNKKEHEKNDFKPCKAPWESIHINVDGNVFPCLAVKVGNVRENSIKEIVLGEKFLDFKNDLIKERSFGACARCGYLLREF